MKAGVSDEEIANRLDIPADKVRESIQRFESVRASVNNEVIDMAVNTEALVALEGVGDDLREARQALRFTGAYDLSGQPIYDRDHTLMLDSISALGSLVEKTRPKGGGVQINTAIQNNGGGNGSNGNGGQGRSFEAMLREAKAQRALTDGGGGGSGSGSGSGSSIAVADTGSDIDIQDADFDDADDADDDESDGDDGLNGLNGLDDPDDAGIDEEMDNGE